MTFNIQDNLNRSSQNTNVLLAIILGIAMMMVLTTPLFTEVFHSV